jgi:hypothetical protein
MANHRPRCPPRGVTAGAAILLGAAIGCNVSVDAIDRVYESATICPFNWQVVLERDSGGFFPNLVERDGLVYGNYVNLKDGNRLLAVPSLGGEPTVLASGVAASALWLEGDDIIFAQNPAPSYSAAKYYRVPVTGGEPELLFDSSSGRSDTAGVSVVDLTPTDFLWTEARSSQISVWHASRADPVAIKIGDALKSTADLAGIAPANDGVVVAYYNGSSILVPYDGSPARTIASPAPTYPIAVDATGVYWALQRPGTSVFRQDFDIVIGPADGGPDRTYWSGLPDNTTVQQMVRTKDGGWIIFAGETFDDMTTRVTIWTLGPTGSAQRIACSPPDYGVGSPPPPAEAPDAFYYGVTFYDRLAESQATRIVRAAR